MNKDDESEIELYNSVIAGDFGKVRKLIQDGAELNTEGIIFHNNSGIHCGHTPLIYAAENNNLEMVKLLVEDGADVNQLSHNHDYPICAASNQPEITYYLIEKGADIFKESNHDNPLTGRCFCGAQKRKDMKQSIVHIAIVVKDYDEAIDFYVNKLHFVLIKDTYKAEQDKRWVVVSPPGAVGTTILLARASKPEQEPFIGNQAGGRVFLFLNTDDFWRDYKDMTSNGIVFVREPKKAEYGMVAVFKDLYGNLWDLLQLNEKGTGSGHR